MKSVIKIFMVLAVVWAPMLAMAGDAVPVKTVEKLYAEKKALSGKTIQVSGKVVKVNNHVMNRNFLHIQDGSGAQGRNDLTVTSKDTAKIGDQVIVIGTLVVDKDFGAGYSYPIIMENASIKPK